MIRLSPGSNCSTPPQPTPQRPFTAADRYFHQPAGKPKTRFGSTAPQQKPDNNSDASIWRDTALRYGGYADEVGEFLSPYLGGLGKFLGYGISTVYCMSDMGTTIPKKYKNAPDDMSTGQKAKKTAAEGADLSAFHLFATLLIPPKIIGAVVQSVERSLNKEALAEAETALTNEGKIIRESGSFLQKTSHKLSELKFKAEKGLGNLVGERMNNIIEQAAETGFMAGAHKNTNKMIEKLGPAASHFVDANAWMAEQYDKLMPFKAFKDTEMPGQLRENAKFLKKNGSQLSKRDVTKLILMKPWPVLVGIGMVPLIAHPFDKMWLKVQDWTIRPLLGKNKIIRTPEGKLQSIHDPDFWGKAPSESKTNSASSVTSLAPSFPASQPNQASANAIQPQALLDMEFGAFRPAPYFSFPGAGPTISPMPFPTNPSPLPTGVMLPLNWPKPVGVFNTGTSQSL